LEMIASPLKNWALAEIYLKERIQFQSFTEAFDTADLQEAKALLAELAN
jgi:hypothetical protein